VAVDAQDRVVLIGSCKWTNAPADVSEYAALLAGAKAASADLKLDAGTIGTTEGPWLAMFSRSGFTHRIEELAAHQEPRRLLLVSLDALYAV